MYFPKMQIFNDKNNLKSKNWPLLQKIKNTSYTVVLQLVPVVLTRKFGIKPVSRWLHRDMDPHKTNANSK
jgi:hypothetical protein